MRMILIPALAAVALAACNGTTAPITGDYESLPADQVLMGVTHHMTVEGVRTAKLLSDTTYVYDDSAAIQLRGVNLELYTETGAVRAYLTSETGELDTGTNRMVSRGSVVLTVQGPNGRTVRTEELHYDPQQKRIWSTVTTCDKPTGSGERCGDSFESDDQFQNFRISRPRGAVELVF
ncbi:MAG TPA: LPS export ABC transporter periplasmic protein LptC [Longimicrobiales bacterium]|nr:LPS export ABC transporter periplasmic protein LptC [Longimicrobiales bacterium]